MKVNQNWIKGTIEVSARKISIGQVEGKIESFYQTPDSMLFAVSRESGEIVGLPVWLEVGNFKHNDPGRMTEIALEKLLNLFEQPAMKNTFGELMLYSVNGPTKMKNRLQDLILNGRRMPQPEGTARTPNVLRSQCITNQEPHAYGPSIILGRNNVRVEIVPVESGIGRIRADSPGHTVDFLGVPCQLRISHPILNMTQSIEAHNAIMEIKEMFTNQYPFLMNADTFKNWSFVSDASTDQFFSKTNPMLCTMSSLINRFERDLKA